MDTESNILVPEGSIITLFDSKSEDRYFIIAAHATLDRTFNGATVRKNSDKGIRYIDDLETEITLNQILYNHFEKQMNILKKWSEKSGTNIEDFKQWIDNYKQSI